MWVLHWIGLSAARALASAGPTPTPITHGDVIEIKNPLGCTEATDCIELLFQGLFKLSIPVVAIMVLVGGFQIMSSGGNEEKLKKGRNTILYAIAGFAIIILANGVAFIIQDVASQAPPGP